MQVKGLVMCVTCAVALMMGGPAAGVALSEAQGDFDAESVAGDGRYLRRLLQGVRWEWQRQVVTSKGIAETLAEPAGVVEDRGRLELHLPFEFDSARMTREGRLQAEELGEAMRMIAADASQSVVWLLVGHTDALGTRSYNRALSVRRAEALREYLVDEFGFDPLDIDIEGRGEDEPVDTAMTEAAHAVNRRVEVVRYR